MITKAQIIALPDNNSNKYTVRIPLLDSAGIISKTTFEATLSYTPGMVYGYKVDDVVFVSFQEDRIDHAVIIGKLYNQKDIEKYNLDSSVTSFLNTLNVQNKACLPSETYIGDIKLGDIINTIKGLEIIETGYITNQELNSAIANNYTKGYIKKYSNTSSYELDVSKDFSSISGVTLTIGDNNKLELEETVGYAYLKSIVNQIIKFGVEGRNSKKDFEVNFIVSGTKKE